MNKRTYEDYMKADCVPDGYNEAVTQYIFGQSTVDMLLDKMEGLEKALELACERVKYFEEMQDKEMGFFKLFGYDSDYDLQMIIKKYKEQALKELQND